jgi:hypothetical protein
MRTYTELTDELTGKKIIQFEEGEKIGWIPCDPANSDYQRYLNPEAEQSTPIVIDEAETK